MVQKGSATNTIWFQGQIPRIFAENLQNIDVVHKYLKPF